MSATLQDVETLVLTCRSEQSREYVSEAVRCYKAGAYRAAIVNTWIAVVFDLIDKVRELALSGDAAAKALETQYETYLKQIEQGNDQGLKGALEYERDILSTCRNKLQFFDQHQYLDLVRLKEDRHRCAHPSFQRVGEPYVPSAEQARLHLRNAIVHVLSQPPVQGKAAISELKLLVSSNYFPTKTELAIALLRSSALATGTEALVKGFIDALIFGFYEKGSALYLRQQVLSALNAIQAMFPGVSEPRFRKQLNKIVRDVPDDLFQGAAVMVAFTDNAWSLLEDPSKNKFHEYLKRATGSEVIIVLSSLSKIPDLQEQVLRRVDTLSYDELSTAISDHRLGASAKNAAMNFVSGVRSWGQANDAINKLIFPIYEHLSKSDIERIIRSSTEHGADLPGANAFEALIEKVRLSGMFAEKDLDALLEEHGARYLAVRRRSGGT